MNDYTASTYGDRIADVYDSMYSPVNPETIELLAELASGGPVLELGIGTGRIALPLSRRGVEVHGVDASEAMIARLRGKPGGGDVAVTIGDFSEFELNQAFPLVFVAFNTIFALQTQDDQIQCFQTVARHLQPGGAFLIEAFVPDLTRFDQDQRISVRSMDADSVTLEATRHDAVGQRVESHLVRMNDEGVSLYPVQLRYAWPSELDAMARLAGLRRTERWASWRRDPFTAASAFHVSVYRK